jgi:hypothetical protein
MITDALSLRTLSVREALAAVEHANDIVRDCESIDDLDDASNWETAHANCPDSFTESQKVLAQQVILRAFEQSIGRA